MKLLTGFSRVDCTPVHGAPLGGYGNAQNRVGNNVILPICVTCTAFKDEEGTVALMFSQDMCGTGKQHTTNFKRMISEKFGIAPENMFFCATHSHSAPSESTAQDMPCMKEWNETKFYPGIMQACENALNDLSECEIYAGKTVLPAYNYVRRYIGTNDKFLGNWSTGNDPEAHHETQPDRELQVIRFKREEGKKDIYMVNWQAHPCFHDGEMKLDISADYPHYLRTVIEKKMDANAVFVQGAAGNLITRGLLPGENYPDVGFISDAEKFLKGDVCEWYGSVIANNVCHLVPALKKLEAGKIKTVEKEVELTVDHTRDAEASKCKEIWDVYSSGKTDEARELAKASGYQGGVYECRDIYFKSRYAATDTFPVWGMSIGDLGFAYFPYEMFDTNGQQVKNASEHKMTFICELTNEGHSYMPSEIAYSHSGYEVRSCKYVVGMSEKLASECVEALNNLKK